jgi:hypothetical protein
MAGNLFITPSASPWCAPAICPVPGQNGPNPTTASPPGDWVTQSKQTTAPFSHAPKQPAKAYASPTMPKGAAQERMLLAYLGIYGGFLGAACIGWFTRAFWPDRGREKAHNYDPDPKSPNGKYRTEQSLNRYNESHKHYKMHVRRAATLEYRA